MYANILTSVCEKVSGTCSARQGWNISPIFFSQGSRVFVHTAVRGQLFLRHVSALFMSVGLDGISEFCTFPSLSG